MHLQVWQWIVGSLEFLVVFAYTGWPKRLYYRGLIGFWIPQWLREELDLLDDHETLTKAIQNNQELMAHTQRKVHQLIARQQQTREKLIYWT